MRNKYNHRFIYKTKIKGQYLRYKFKKSFFIILLTNNIAKISIQFLRSASKIN